MPVRMGFFVFLLFVLFMPVACYGQTFTGDIAGTIRDTTAAVTPGAIVTVTSKATGATKTFVTSEDGSYRFAELPPACYLIKVELKGFKAATREVVLSVAQKLRADFTLEVGSPEEILHIETMAGPLAVQTESYEISHLISAETLVELPTVTRNGYDLVFLSPLVNFDPGGRGAVGGPQNSLISGGGDEGGSAINGMRSSSNNFLLDGGENNDPFLAQVGQQVPLDAIQEFRVHPPQRTPRRLNSYSVEYGRNAGSIINVVTKSGSNRFHGSLYEFYRGSGISAIDPEDKATQFRQGVRDIRRPAFVRNQFGFTSGGPIVRNKTFAFGSAEWIRVRSMAPRGFFVPTAQLINASASNMQEIFRAFPPPSSSGPFLTARDLARIAPNLSHASGNPIPPDTPLFGLTNLSAPVDAGGGAPQNSVMCVAKVDHRFSERTQLSARYAFEDLDFFKGGFSLSPYAAFNTGSESRNQNIAVQMNHTLNPKFVTEARFVYHRISSRNPLGSNGIRLYSLNNINRFVSCQFLPPTDPAQCIGQPRTRRRLNNSGVTEFNRRGNEGLPRYHAMFMAADSAYIKSAGLWFGGNWTWGHALTNTRLSLRAGTSPYKRRK